MAIDFPASPTTGQLFTAADVTWKWEENIIIVPAEDRTIVVPPEDRTIVVPAESRIIEVPDDPR